jgi:hypothetical protein
LALNAMVAAAFSGSFPMAALTLAAQADRSLSSLAQIIQISIAPVFLLSGVAAFLNVLHARLLRVIDRTRFLEAEEDDEVEASAERVASRDAELTVLFIRRHWINRAITLCTVCAILTSGVVALMFVGTFIHLDLAVVVAVIFVIAMLCLIVGLLSFLREVHLAVRHFRRSAGRARPRLKSV